MKRIILPILVLLFLSCKTETKKIIIDDTYKAELDLYRTEKNDGRKKGYLKLAGLFRMNSGINSFGKDSINNLRLKIDDLPPTIATFIITDKLVSFQSSEDIAIKNSNDSIITSMPMKLNEYGSSVRLYYDRINWQVITRSGEYYLRVWDEKNPAIEAYKGFKHFDINSDLIFDAQFTYYDQPKEEMVKSEVDGQRNTSFLGKVSFEFDGESHDLDVGGSGFTMVSDATTGEETYGGGRYIYITLPKSDSIVRLDFNKLYNPPCAYNEYTTCLYPPRQNHIPFKIAAGEKMTPND